MKKLLLATVASLSLGAVATTSHAADLYQPAPSVNMYASVFGGLSLMDDYNAAFITGGGTVFPYTRSFDKGFIAGGAIGLEFMPGWRAEVEAAIFETDFDRTIGQVLGDVAGIGSMQAVTVLGNIWYDFDLGSGLRPYVGGGVGVGFVDSDHTPTGAIEEWNDSDTVLAYQVGAGVKFAVSDAIDIDASYRFRGLSDVGFSSSIGGYTVDSEDVYTHVIQVGLAFKFGAF